MCGINGILRLDPDAPPIDREEVVRTREAMAARGPDGAGLWLSPTGEIALASRRLAILDLGPAGSQPMASRDGRHHIVFNGEVYNFAELRGKLEREGCGFASRSDTEVLLNLYARQGTSMLRHLRGMYAFAIWDAVEQSLFLARDPYGIKPLYYSASGGFLRFASQVKALERGGGVSLDVDPAGLAGFLLWGCVPEPCTIRRSIQALPAGSFLKVQRGKVQKPTQFFCFGQEDDELEELDIGTAVSDSTRAHLVSDVPVALFLSGGMDSALVGALAVRHLSEPPISFTLTFDEFAGSDLDEGPMARRVAASLGTRHVERRVRAAEFRDLWPEIIRAMDQPSIDGFNTFVVSRVARESGLKVVLSGLGGDELFGGYSSFSDVPRLLRVGRIFRRENALWTALARISGGRPKMGSVPQYAATLPSAYFLRRSLFLPAELPAALGAEQASEGLARYDPVSRLGALLETYGRNKEDLQADPWISVHVLESLQYMRNQLLRDSDWASMANSLELRVPLVDTRLRACLSRHGFEPARQHGKGTTVERIVPELPKELFRRRKSGFAMPVLRWLTGEKLDGRLSHWGWQSRVLALRVLREFDIECDARALPNDVRRSLEGGFGISRRPAPAVPAGRRKPGTRDSGGVLLLMSNVQGAFGGIPSFNRALIKALVPLAHGHGSTLTVLALMDPPADGGARPFADGVTYRAFNAHRVRFALRAIFESYRARTLIVGHVNFSPLALLSASRAFLVVYGVDAWRRFGGFWRMSFRRFNRILSISAFTRDRMAQLNGLDPGRFTILPSVLDPSHERDERHLTREELDLPPGPMLLSVARLDRTERYKGVSDVIASLPKILEGWPRVFYVIVGDGDDRPGLEALAVTTGVARHVRFVGSVPDERLTSYYRAADVFVLPSGKEGFGIVFLEAMYQERPCVGGSAGGTPEVIADGTTGFLVAPGDRSALATRIGELLGDGDLCRQMGRIGRRLVEDRYTLRSMSERLERVLWQ